MQNIDEIKRKILYFTFFNKYLVGPALVLCKTNSNYEPTRHNWVMLFKNMILITCNICQEMGGESSSAQEANIILFGVLNKGITDENLKWFLL